MTSRQLLAVLAASVATTLCASAHLAAADDLNTIEHIVIFMQENRPTDHYFGSMKGVRGFNDRAAPTLPSGAPIWQQPTAAQNHSKLCGCDACDIEWTSAGGDLKGLLEDMTCPELAGALTSAVPPVTISEGEQCSQVLTALLGSSFDHLKFSDFIYPNSSCAAGIKVSGLPSEEAEVAAIDADAADPYILPFHLSFDKTAATCMPAPAMAYPSDINIYNDGRCDSWNSARDPGFGMSYFLREDLPFYYALGDAFTFGDQYFQSTFTATNPNRQHLFAGSNGLSVPGSGYCELDDSEPQPGFTWETMGETLEDAGISWRVVQQEDNFDDNANAWFANYRAAKPGDPLFDKGMATVPDIVKEFTNMLVSDTLPQVTYIVGPANASEHAENHPQDGEDLSARLINAMSLPEAADVYKKTAFILNYDEGGQFFDHHWPPGPPKNAKNGKSTVTVTGELTLQEYQGIPAGNPIGLGYRVPLFIVSPWTRGGNIYSEVADHTSVLQLIEKRFGVTCPNISPWRRAVTGDLTRAFDFSSPNYTFPAFPSTSGNWAESKRECDDNPPPELPTVQSMPSQEPGTKPSRALGYEFNITAATSAGSVALTIDNTGEMAGAFLAFNLLARSATPRKYTVESGKSLSDAWATTGAYAIRVHGPNGFVRDLNGSTAVEQKGLAVHLGYDKAGRNVVVFASGEGCDFIVTDNAYGLGGPWTLSPKPVMSEIAGAISVAVHPVDVSASGNWYDLSVTAKCSGDAAPNGYARRFMGRMETGEHLTTDPAMGAGVPGVAGVVGDKHPRLPDKYRIVAPFDPEAMCTGRRMLLKDICWDYVHAHDTEL